VENGVRFGLPGIVPHASDKFQNGLVRGAADGLLDGPKVDGARLCQGAIEIEEDGVDRICVHGLPAASRGDRCVDWIDNRFALSTNP
jgi:hypothetical protein